MNEINKLSADISNKIAAGEVAENPFHVVKELVENSLDSGATVIHVAIQNGGLGSIIIRDNGMGILPQDMPLTVQRFCTSKVKSFYDPSKITTMGFRGEALAAISSVSEFELHSMREGYDAKRLTITSNGVVTVADGEPISGTRIIVRNLFYNVPARRKFMKTPGHYTREITRFVKLFATVNLDIEVKLTCDAKETFVMQRHLPFNARAAHMLNNNNILVAETITNNATVLVAATDPTVQKPRRNGIMFAINGRVVNDPYLTNAVVQAYHRLIPANTYPLAVVLIVMDTSEIDVNVHPNKLEIRLLNQRNVFSMVHRCVLKALAEATVDMATHSTETTGGITNTTAYPPTPTKNRTTPNNTYPTNSHGEGSSIGDELFLQTLKEYKGQQVAGVASSSENPLAGVYDSRYGKSRPMAGSKADSTAILQPQGGFAPQPQAGFAPQPQAQAQPQAQPQAGFAPQPQAQAQPQAGFTLQPQAQAQPQAGFTPQPQAQAQPQAQPLTALAQLGNMFILCKNSDNDLVIVDQHIAHERVLYEKLQLDQNTRKPTMRLHTPVEVEISQEERDTLTEHHELLTAEGFIIDNHTHTSIDTSTDKTMIRILQAPMEISKTDVANSVKRILKELLQETPISGLDKTSMTLSCRKAIKAGDPLGMFEMQNLLEQLAQTSNPLTCPHGRPIVVPITLAKIKTMFGR